MSFQNRARPVVTAAPRRGLEDLHRWVESLPWVVERPITMCAGVRMFGVDCPPLGRRRMWLVTGLGDDATDDSDSVSVIVPEEVALAAERMGWGRRSMPMPERHALVRSTGPVDSDSVVALVLAAYQHAVQ